MKIRIHQNRPVEREWETCPWNFNSILIDAGPAHLDETDTERKMRRPMKTHIEMNLYFVPFLRRLKTSVETGRSSVFRNN